MTTQPVRALTHALLAGAFLLPAISRLTAQTTPPGPTSTASPNAAGNTATANPSEEIVRLEEFKVSTTIGSYAETSSSTAAKIPVDLKDIAATIQVFNQSFVSDKLALSLEDLYPYVVGMTRESAAATGFTLRGFTNNATNTLLNNVQYDGQSGGGSRFGSPTTANVERVEVLKGPNSVLYGAMSPGGVINIITKSPSAKRAGSIFTSAATYAGEQGKNGQGFTATVDLTGPIDDQKHWLYRVITSYEDVASWRQFDWGRNHYFFPSLTYRLDKDTDVTAKVEVLSQHRAAHNDQNLVAPFDLISLIPSDHSIVYQDRNNAEYDRGEVYSLFARHAFANKWTTKFSVRDVQHVDGRRLLENRSFTSRIPVETSTITQRLRDTWNRRRYAYGDLTLYGDVGPETFKHTLLFGVSYGYEMESFTRWIFANPVGPAINLYNPIHDLTVYPVYNPVAGPTQIAVQKYFNYAGYFSDQIKIGKEWRASIGVHADKYVSHYHDWALLNGKFVNPGAHNNSKSAVPSFGVVYQPIDMVSLYANYSKGFKPSIAQAIDGYGNPRPPEKAEQKEVGAKIDLLNRTVGVLVSAYDITRNNVTEAPVGLIDANGVQIFRTLTQRSKGIEVSVNYQPKPFIQVQIGYTYDDARCTQSAVATIQGAQLANAPRQTGNFWGRYNVPDGALRGFGVGVGVIYTGQRNGLVSNVPSGMLAIPANTRGDVALYYNWKRYEFAVNVTNVTDVSYIASADADTDVIPGAPRKVTASLRYSF